MDEFTDALYGGNISDVVNCIKAFFADDAVSMGKHSQVQIAQTLLAFPTLNTNRQTDKQTD